MRLRFEALAVFLLALAACTTRVSLSEGTTARIGNSGGVLASADNLFELRIPASALDSDTDISIITDRLSPIADVTSAIYRVSPAGLVFHRPVVASYRAASANGPLWIGRRALGTVDEGAFVELPTSDLTPAYDRRTHVARGEITSLEERAFAMATLHEKRRCSGVSCGTPCGECLAIDPGCMPDPNGSVCSIDGQCARPDPICPTQGWTAAPGSGQAFVVNSLALDSTGIGRVIDSSGNDLIREAIFGGQSLLLIELAGFDYSPAYGEDPQLAVKIYEAQDADEPAFIVNNFSQFGADPCCRFRIQTSSLEGSPLQAKARLPARLAGGVIDNVGMRDEPELGYPFLALGAPIPLELARFELDFASDATALTGKLGGVVSISSLAHAINPYCQEDNPLCPGAMVNSTMLDLFASLLDPDTDIDQDGLERVILGPDGRVAQCIDGDGSIVPPLTPTLAASCVDRPEMADGYLLTYDVVTVAATIVGLAQ